MFGSEASGRLALGRVCSTMQSTPKHLLLHLGLGLKLLHQLACSACWRSSFSAKIQAKVRHHASQRNQRQRDG